MRNEAFAVSLPLFDDSALMMEALEDPQTTAFGAVVSTRGGADFQLHSLEELFAARSRYGPAITFADLPYRRLKPLSPRRIELAGWNLRIPSAKRMDTALRTFGTVSGIGTVGSGSTSGRTALVFSTPSGTYVVVGKTYFCSRFLEIYGEPVYRANGGNCPKHAGARLLLKT